MNMGSNIRSRNKSAIKGFFTGNPPTKCKWFFPILRTYGWYHWLHHTDTGQLYYFIAVAIGICVTIFSIILGIIFITI